MLQLVVGLASICHKVILEYDG